jgi:hypothetical protein
MNQAVSRFPQAVKPSIKDYLLFYLLVPFCLSILFTSFEIRLVSGMPFLDGLGYMMIHLAAAWWGIDLGSRVMRRLCASWRPPASAIIVMGFFVMLVPLTFFFQALGEIYAARYPSFAAARTDTVMPSWSLQYVLHFLRFSVTALPMYIVGAYGYQFVTGVAWYSYEQPPSGQAPTAEADGQAAPTTNTREQPQAQLLSNCQLPADAVLLAIKAEEHYIRVWSDQGTDLIRYRFQDVADLLEPYSGIRVHRSWWVNANAVVSVAKKGRSLELALGDGLKVPVSLAYKEAVSSQLGHHIQ